MEDKMTVLIVEPEKKPYVKEIDSGLRSLQHEVEGYIETVPASPMDNALIICDEEGKIYGKPLNRGLRDKNGDMYDIIAGTFLIVGDVDGDFVSLTPKQIEFYKDYYGTPELFMRMNDKIIATPILDEFVQDQTPYTKSISHALHHGEMPQFHYSYEQNVRCSECISNAIRNNFDGMSLRGDVLAEPIQQFGRERVEMILALTILDHEYDGRISPENKEWAKNLPIAQKMDVSYRSSYCFICNTHPGLLNLAVNQYTRNMNDRNTHEHQNKAIEKDR